MSFFAELKRRNVIRVGIAYAVTAWLLLQLTEVLTELLELSNEIGKTVILLLLIGFIPALLFAWAFEMTPEGIKKEKDVDRTQSITPQTGRKLDRTIIAVLAIALAWFAWDKFSGQSIPQPTTTADTTTAEPETTLEKSIAVLPFVNMSANQDNEYFSDGLSEELLNLLAKVDGLKVAARTSAFKFKDAEADIAEIGGKLNVATVLEGSVRREGNQARITAQLIKVDDGFHLWSETYDRELDNIFQVQDEIAQAIVDALKLPLLGEDQEAVAAFSPTNFETYDLYLLGRHHYRQRNESGFLKAREFFERAVAIDPNYARGWSGLAMANMLLSDYGSVPFAQAVQQAEAAIEKALDLNPDLPETLVALAIIKSYQRELLQEAAAAEKALSIDPENIQALTILSSGSAGIDDDRRLQMAQKALELDPLSEETRVNLSAVYNQIRDYQSSIDTARRFLLDDPQNPGLHEVIAQAYAQMGKTPQAIEAFKRTHELRPGDVFPAAMIAFQFLVMDDLDNAEAWLEVAHERGPNSNWAKVTELAIGSFKQESESLLSNYKNTGFMAAEMSGWEAFWVVDASIKTGRNDIARALIQSRLEGGGTLEHGISSMPEVRHVSRLCTLLDDGPEKQALLESLDLYVETSLEKHPEARLTWMAKAYAHAVRGERLLMIEAMEQTLERGGLAPTFTRDNPVFAAYSNDPLFQELILKLRANAEEKRKEWAELAAGSALETSS